MLLRRIACFVGTMLVIGATLACGPPRNAKSMIPDLACHRTIQYAIDPEFTNEEAILVVQSVYAWQEGSSKAVCFIPGAGGFRIRRATDPKLVHALEQRGALSNGIKPESVVGLAEFPNAWILRNKLVNNQDFYATTIHEVGHLLGLSHYEPGRANASGASGADKTSIGPAEPSWMYPGIDRSPHDGSHAITERDRRALLDHESIKR